MAVVLEEDFEGYSLGDLNGQGSWSGSAIFDVIDTLPKIGSQSVSSYNTGGDQSIEKTGTLETDGVIGMYMRKDTVGGTTPAFDIMASSTMVSRIVAFDGGNWKFLATGSTWVDTGITCEADTWYWTEIEWESTEGKIRVQIDDNGWSSWYYPYGLLGTGIDTIKLWAFLYAGGAETIYFDYIDDEPYEEPVSLDEFGEFLAEIQPYVVGFLGFIVLVFFFRGVIIIFRSAVFGWRRYKDL